MARLPQIQRSMGIGCHSYVDDTQFWVGFSEDNNSNSINNETEARKMITRAFSTISSFMHDSNLKLNPSKNQFIPFSRKNSPSDLSALQLEDGVCIEHYDEVRNLGVVMYYKLSIHSHANSIRKSGFLQLTRLQFIRSFILKQQFVTLVHAFITSRLDFCNSIVYCLPDSLVNRAIDITGAKKFDWATTAVYTGCQSD